jgi:hypothetical protein
LLLITLVGFFFFFFSWLLDYVLYLVDMVGKARATRC